MKSLFVASLLLCCLLIVSCGPPAPDVAEVRKTIEGMTEQMEKELLSEEFDSTLARYTDDAISMPNFGPISRGKAEILALYRQMRGMEMKVHEAEFTVTDVEVGGNYAYEIGTYDMTFSMMGMPPMPDKGKYVTIWELQEDGTWKIKVETWNTDMQPPIPGMEDDEDEDKEHED
ncbi:MAG: DUF4440 domain-containing protein [Bacteroidetes bacterium]|nr:DUF4440 domain-containing protein [Bacteroidota bacterium]